MNNGDGDSDSSELFIRVFEYAEDVMRVYDEFSASAAQKDAYASL